MKKLKYVLSAILTALLFLTTLAVASCSDKTQFSSDKWKQSDYHQRYLMLDDFSKNNYIIGWNIDEVTALLGDPERKDDVYMETYPPQFGGYILEYYISSRSEYKDFEILRITTNSTSIVTSAEYDSKTGTVRSIYKN